MNFLSFWYIFLRSCDRNISPEAAIISDLMSSMNINLAITTRFIRAAVLMTGVLLPLNSTSGVDQRRLSFFHTHTHETLEVTYSVGGEYVESALDEINDFLADFRTGDEIVIDPLLLDLIYDVRASLNSNGTYEVISGEEKSAPARQGNRCTPQKRR